MEFHLFKADKDRKKWSIRGTLWNGRIGKFSGHRDLKIAEKIRDNIASLNRSKHLGELLDPSLLPWLNDLPETEAQQLVEAGLIPQRLLDKRRPIEELIEGFAAHLRAKRPNGSRWVKMKSEMVRRVFAALGPGKTYNDLDEDQMNAAINAFVALEGRRKGEAISQKTRREYIFAMKSFCAWMVKKRGATTNPLADVVAPAAKGAPVLNRRPMKVDEFSKLVSYLRTAPPKYAHQIFDWTPEDRLMLYWTAVLTGFRANELRSLTVASVDFDADPVRITVQGWAAKNRTKATVPVDSDFARELQAYSRHRLPTAPLLRMPSSSMVTAGLYRDLDAAGVRRVFDNGDVVDFHTLRSTAIYWWLKYNRLTLPDVQYRARLKTLSLVQEYVRNHVPEYEELVSHTPKMAYDGKSVIQVS